MTSKCLNPYSTGTPNLTKRTNVDADYSNSLNPYSTGTPNLTAVKSWCNLFKSSVLILILLEHLI